MEYENLDPDEILAQFNKTPRQQFIEGCLEAYELFEQGAQIGEVGPDGSECLAIRRILGFFIDAEEYEKCSLIKRILEEKFPGQTEPVFDFRDL